MFEKFNNTKVTKIALPELLQVHYDLPPINKGNNVNIKGDKLKCLETHVEKNFFFY